MIRQLGLNEFRAFADILPADIGGKTLVLEFFGDRFGFHSGKTLWPHQ